jgi:hypothetical protein
MKDLGCYGWDAIRMNPGLNGKITGVKVALATELNHRVACSGRIHAAMNGREVPAP